MTAHIMKRTKMTATFLLLGLLIIPALAVNVQAVTYTYDDAGRLIKADYGGGQIISYQYDPAGNVVLATSKNPDNTLKVGVSPADAGNITGTGINCPGDCEQSFPASPSISLTAKPKAGFKFLGWTGDASGKTNPLSIKIDGDKGAMAYFGATDGNTDDDSLPDVDEMGPSGKDFTYDGDRNGVPDYQEAGTASLHTKNGKAYVTLTVPTGTKLREVKAKANPSPSDSPADIAFPFGFFSFKVTGLDPGGAVDVVLLTPLYTSISSYYKHGPLPGSPTPQWYPFNVYDGKTGEEIFHEADRTRIILNFWDGLRGDDVETQDGMIIDDGGPAAPLDAEPDIHVDRKTLSFGQVAAAHSKTLSVTVSNQAGGELVIGKIAQADPLATPFRIKEDACSDLTLENGESCKVTVAFKPTAAGQFSDSFDIPSNDTGETPFTIYIAGSGATTQSPRVGPNIQVTPDSRDFGQVDVGSYVDSTVTVSNSGQADLTLGNIASLNPLGVPFHILDDGCSGKSLVTGAQCTVSVRFAPASARDFSDDFDIPSNDPDENPVTVKVSAAGTVVPTPDIAASPTELSFGRVSRGRSAELDVTVLNEGDADLTLGTVGQTHALAPPFSVRADSCSGQTLAPAGQCTVRVRFSPTAAGSFSDGFDIPSDDPDEGRVTVEVSGIGTADITPALMLLLSDEP